MDMDVHATIQWVLESKLMCGAVAACRAVLSTLGFPPPYPDEEQLGLWMSATLTTLAAYYVVVGKRHRRKRKRLQAELRSAQARVALLEEKLLDAEGEDDAQEDGEQVRIWMDGAFDMMHYGHMNAFRQGKALGTYLIVGVNSDESIAECKGPPVMNDYERLTAVQGCKFVDEVVPGVPYVMSEEYLEYVIDKYRIDYVVHGDDPCIVNGKDVYASAKARGKYRTIPRTEGVSTTDIVGRMLLRSKSHHAHSAEDKTPQLVSGKGRAGAIHVRSKFLTTSRMLRLFSGGVKAPHKGARVVYIDGAWDMFHAGHVSVLKKAREFGDYLVAGVHGDEVVNSLRGLNMPIMNLNERVLSVLGCAYVDDVLIDAPLDITREMISSLNISAVVHGTVDDHIDEDGVPACETALHTWAAMIDMDSPELGDGISPYTVAEQTGIFHEVESPSNLTVMEIVGRIQKNQEIFQKKFAKKKAAEDEYYVRRYNLNGSS